MRVYNWRCRERTLQIGKRALLMGIVNVTPDSFSDGGQHFTTQSAVDHALKLIADGADILDIGGESSRPGAVPVSLNEELNRVVPVVEQLAKLTSLPISVDTVKPEVVRQALRAGAHVVNDITALQDPAMIAVVREYGAGVVLMHMQGTPETMQQNPNYSDVVGETCAFLEGRIRELTASGIGLETIALDPGIGFGKTHEHTLEQLRRLRDYQRLGRPVCLGVSRKGFLGIITGKARHERAVASVAVACHALANGAAQILRVHDVAEHCDAARVFEALAGGVERLGR
jgi:dihydropteroate synthase